MWSSMRVRGMTLSRVVPCSQFPPLGTQPAVSLPFAKVARAPQPVPSRHRRAATSPAATTALRRFPKPAQLLFSLCYKGHFSRQCRVFSTLPTKLFPVFANNDFSPVFVIPLHRAPKNCKIFWVISGGTQLAPPVPTCVIWLYYTSWLCQLVSGLRRNDDERFMPPFLRFWGRAHNAKKHRQRMLIGPRIPLIN